MSKEIVNIRINKDLPKGKLKWYSYHPGETFEAERKPFEDFFSYHLTKKGLDKLDYLNKEKNVDKSKCLSAIVYNDSCEEIMYLVYARPDDHWEPSITIGYATTEQEAKAACEKRTKMYEVYKEVKEKTDALASAVEMEKNESRLEIPKWKAGIHQKDITPEMREARNSIHKKNEAINERNAVKYLAWNDARNKAKEDYIDLLEYDEDTMKFLKKHLLGSYTSGLYLSGYDYKVVKRI